VNLVCDECGAPVRFSGLGRTFEHTRPTTCTGIDGLVLGVPVAEWRHTFPAAVTDLSAARTRRD
jgi:hypothetical protein